MIGLKSSDEKVIHTDEGARWVENKFQNVFTLETENFQHNQPGGRWITLGKKSLEIFGRKKVFEGTRPAQVPCARWLPTISEACRNPKQGVRDTCKISLKEVSFADGWDRSNEVSVFKKDNRKVVLNYRHMSLTKAICKILEEIIIKINRRFFFLFLKKAGR